MKFATDENWSRYTRPPYPYSHDNAQEFLADRVGLSRPDQTVWCLEFHYQMIGDLGFAWHLQNRSAEIAYRLLPKFRNQGLITAASNTAIDTAFQHDKALNRIYAAIDSRNAASIRVMPRL